MYKTNMDHHASNEYIGLDNKICENPTHYCKIHLIYLSDSDVERKKCLCKPTYDMISTAKCKALIPISEYEAEKETHKLNIKKINDSRVNLGMSSYSKIKENPS